MIYNEKIALEDIFHLDSFDKTTELKDPLPSLCISPVFRANMGDSFKINIRAGPSYGEDLI